VDIATFLRPWSGFLFRHIPAASPYDVLDFRFAGLAADNRWNARGEPTLYLASDRGVALAEFARHLGEDRRMDPATAVVARRVFRLQVTVPRVLDLRDPNFCSALSLKEAPYCFVDKGIARAVAQFLRRTTPAQALIAPSVAFLDDADRFIAVLFLDKLPVEVARFIPRALPDGLLSLSPEQPEGA
jgi:RES domain-containing protein